MPVTAPIRLRTFFFSQFPPVSLPWRMPVKRDGRSCSISRMLLLVTCIAFGLSLASLDVHAQSAATLEAFTKEAHVGSTFDALVGVVVTNKAVDGTVQTRYGNGLLLRCDGFVLVPVEMFNTRNVAGAAPAVPDQTISVYLHPGTDQEKRVQGRRPNWYGFIDVGVERYRLGYAVLKLDNVHAPAGRTLMPDTLATGDTLRVAWSPWDATTAHFKPVETRNVVVGTRKQPDPKDKTPELFRLQTTPFAKPLEAVPPGALVVGPEDLAVGMVIPKRAEDVAEFSNFACLHLATNCITPLPCTDATFMKRVAYGNLSIVPVRGDNEALPISDGNGTKTTKQTAKPVDVFSDDMVPVPGGPVRLPPVIQSLQMDMEASKVACIAPFLIDRNEVTNAQYLQFWKALPPQMRRSRDVQADLYPYSWGPEDKPFPSDLAEVPVLSVRLPGARAYARWVGKRLPTPYEWCLAAFGPSGGNVMPDWVKQFLQQRQKAWIDAVAAHQKYALENPEMIPMFDVVMKQVQAGNSYVSVPETYGFNGATYYALTPNTTHARIQEFYRIPWYFQTSRAVGFQDAAEWSKQKVLELTDPMFNEWVDPIYVLPIGSRPFDISPYGAVDMLLNARELVAPGPGYPWNRPPGNNWPTREIDRYIHIDFTLSDAERAHHPVTLIGEDLYVPKLETNFPLDKLHEMPTALQLLSGIPFIEHDGRFPLSFNQSYNYLPFQVTDLQFDVAGRRLSFSSESEIRLHNHTDEMRSRRFRTAYENEQAFDAFHKDEHVPPGESLYLRVHDALAEIAELLRPVNQVEVSLKSGPSYDLIHELTVSDYHHVLYSSPGPPTSYASRKVGSKRTDSAVPGTLYNTTVKYGPPILTETGSFTLWSQPPRHYHTEIGRIPDHSLEQDIPRGEGPNNSIHGVIPDTYVVPGGFRCVR